MAKRIMEIETAVINYRRIINMIKNITDEILITIDKECISAIAVDPAHVAMIYIKWYPKFFYEYQIHKPGFKIGLNLSMLKEAIYKLGSTERLRWIYTDEQMNIFSMDEVWGSFRKKHFAIDPETLVSGKIPNLKLKYEDLCVDTRYFKRAIQKMTLSDHLEISSNGFELKISNFNTYEETHGTKKIENKNTEEMKLKVLNKTEKRKSVSSLFSIDYLNSIIENIPSLFEKTYISLGQDNPIILKFIWNSCFKVKLCEATYMLAPRIESE
jgi:proliferating cell nuclear antigen